MGPTATTQPARPAPPDKNKHKILARFIMDPLSPVPSRMSLQQQHRITQQQRYTALLQHDRESEGRCGLCGVQTHRMCYRDSGVGSILCKEPLDVEGEVRRGRCLLCHPMPDGDFSVHSGRSSVSGCVSHPLVMNISPSHVNGFPFMMNPHLQQQQHVAFPPLPLQPHHERGTTRLAMPQEPSLTTIIQSLPNSDITSILTLMRIYPASRALISTALQTLEILSSDEQNAAALGRVGGIGTILDSMACHLNCITTIQSGAATLHNLSLNAHNLLFMADSVPTLVNVMNSHTLHAGIQRSSILALGNIAKYNIDYKILICEQGGMLAIMKAVQNFGDNAGSRDLLQVQVGEGVLRAAYWSLRRLGMPRLRGLAVGRSGGEEESDEDDA